MSQIEQDFRQMLSRKPEIEKCYSEGLINRRALARYLISKNIAQKNQLEAVIAMLRRFEFKKKEKEHEELFQAIRVAIKDSIIIFDFDKDKELLQKIQKLLSYIDYDKGDTLKIVIGSTSIKLFIDQKNEKKFKEVFSEYKLRHIIKNVSEISLMFSDNAVNAKGILSTITRELALNDIVITEFLTASPELLIYVKEGYVIKTYEIIKQLQKEI